MPSNAPITYPELDKEVLRSDTQTLLTVDKWTVRGMSLSWPKITALWEIVRQYKTLFSDITRDDFDNFVRLVTLTGSYWLEVYEDEALVGVIYFTDVGVGMDIEAHMVFFDRKPAEKLPVCQAVIRHIFMNFPVNRITVKLSSMYYATIRLVKKLGFAREGTMREAVLLGGSWVDVVIFGILRREVM